MGYLAVGSLGEGLAYLLEEDEGGLVTPYIFNSFEYLVIVHYGNPFEAEQIVWAAGVKGGGTEGDGL